MFSSSKTKTRCTGCNACRVACKDWHDQPSGPASWMRINYFEEGPFPNIFAGYLISNCYQCEDPVCAYICPNEAIEKREKDGIVIVDTDKCEYITLYSDYSKKTNFFGFEYIRPLYLFIKMNFV